MICDSCINVIIRTFQNGGQDPYTVRVCSLDGLTVTYQLRECSRKEGKKVEEPAGYYKEIRLPEPVLPKECLHHATLEAGGTLRDGKCVVCNEYVPPLKKRGNPKWRKRGA